MQISDLLKAAGGIVVYTSRMRFILTLLLTFAMMVSAYASAGQVRICCPDEDCGIAQCVDMGCLPTATPMIPQVAAAMPQWNTLREVPEELQMYLPNRYKEVWTPPD